VNAVQRSRCVIGADASRARVSVHGPTHGWVDFDPTHDALPDPGHIPPAWGRDFGDVSPLRGIIQGGGEHELRVRVTVAPVEHKSGLPILDLERRHAFEFIAIVRHQDKATCAGLCSNKRVVRADRLSSSRKQGANLTRLARIVPIESQHVELQRIYQPHVMGGARAPEGAKVQRVQNNG
jgi:hypothetical protein